MSLLLTRDIGDSERIAPKGTSRKAETASAGRHESRSAGQLCGFTVWGHPRDTSAAGTPIPRIGHAIGRPSWDGREGRRVKRRTAAADAAPAVGRAWYRGTVMAIPMSLKAFRRERELWNTPEENALSERLRTISRPAA